jgi:hypothetical protein
MFHGSLHWQRKANSGRISAPVVCRALPESRVLDFLKGFKKYE